MRAFAQLWDEITAERYGVEDPQQRRFRYGVQVNSLGLTEAQPENNVQRIVLEMLAVTLSRDARARAIQLPAWNEALGLPRPWDQQWSLRMQQVLAFETDLLEYEDLFDGSRVVEAKVAELVAGAQAEIDRVLEMGGAVAAVESGYMKRQLVASLAQRRRRIESGEDVVVGVNRFESTEPSPLQAERAAAIETVDPAVEAAAVAAIAGVEGRARRGGRRRGARRAARRREDRRQPHGGLDRLREGGRHDRRVGGGAARGVRRVPRAHRGVGPPVSDEGRQELAAVRERVRATGEELGTRLRMLVGKPGLDGHSNGAEQVAVRARDAGFEVVYQGIRLTPAQIVAAAVQEDVHVVGLSVLSGSHLSVVPAVVEGLRAAGAVDVPVVVGGIIPPEDAEALRGAGSPRCSRPRTTGSPRCSTPWSRWFGKPAGSALDIRIVIFRIPASKLPTG